MEPGQISPRQSPLVELFRGAPIAKTTGMRLHYNEAAPAVFVFRVNSVPFL